MTRISKRVISMIITGVLLFAESSVPVFATENEEIISEVDEITTDISTEEVSEVSGEICLEATALSGACGDNLFYTLTGDEDTGYTLSIEGSGDMSDYSTSFLAPWFEYGDKINKLELAEDITSIGDFAFYHCTNITGDLKIPSNVTRIGELAFCECIGFTGDLLIPTGVTTIGDAAFSNCINFNGRLSIPSSVTSIGRGAFYQCRSLTGRLVIPSGITKIEESTFRDCFGLSGDLVIPKGVTSIGHLAFASDTGLSGTVTISNVDTAFMDDPFHDCRNIAKIVNLSVNRLKLPELWPDQGNWYIEGDESKTKITRISGGTAINSSAKPEEIVASGECGDNVTYKIKEAEKDEYVIEISGTGPMANYEYTDVPWVDIREKITGVVINEGVTSIGDNAFNRCINLKGNIEIPEGVTYIGTSAFYNCGELTGDLIIPDSVTSIANYAFWSCNNLDGKLKLSKNLESIGASVFYSCTKLSGNLSFSDGLTSIGPSAFYCCEKLTGDLILPSSVTTIGNIAFFGCTGIDRVENNSSLELELNYIDNKAWWYKEGDATKEKIDVISNGVAVKGKKEDITDVVESGKCGDTLYYKITGDEGVGYTLTIYGTGDMYDYGQKLPPWYFSYISPDVSTNVNLVLEEGITHIGNAAFNGGVNICSELSIPSSVTSIGEFAFGNCKKMTGGIVIPEGVTSVSKCAFNGDSSLSGELVIPNGVTSIGESAFENCSSLTGKLNIPDTVTYIGRFAFDGCKNLTGDLIIPNGVEELGLAVFEGCSGLKGKLVIPNSVLVIGQEAFCGCSGLTGDLILPSGVREIGVYAFRYCENLTGDLILPEDLATLGNYAFSGCKKLTGDLVIPKQITRIGMNTFEDCSGLNGKLVIPKGVAEIGQEAFKRCSSLTGDVVIPSTVKTVGQMAFTGCSNISSIIIPETVEVVGSNIISLCSNLTRVVNEKENEISLPSLDGYNWYLEKDQTKTPIKSISKGVAVNTRPETVATGKCGDNLIYKITGTEEDGFALEITGTGPMWNYTSWRSSDGKEGYTSAPWGNYRDYLVTVVFNEGITRIGHYAFYNCQKLSGDLIIPDGIETIGQYSFYGCSGLTGDIYIPSTTKIIEKMAFKGCTNISSLTIPQAVESVESEIIDLCTSLTRVVNETENVVILPILNDSKWYLEGDMSKTKIKHISNGTAVTGPISIFSVKFYSQDGQILLWNEYVDEGKSAIGPEKTMIPQIKGYRFVKWSASVENITSDTTVFAIYVKDKCKITLDTQAAKYDPIYVNGGETVKLPIPIAKGLVFKGWYPTEDGSGEPYTDETVITEDVVLYAFWNYADISVKGVEDSYEYTGLAIKPVISVYDGSVKLVEKVDYTVTYKNTVNIYQYSKGESKFRSAYSPAVIVTGKGNYNGTKTIYFKIEPHNLRKSDVNVGDINAIQYTGKVLKPVPVVTVGNKKLVNKRDFEVSYFAEINCLNEVEPINPGTYYARVTGINNYKSYVVKPFKVVGKEVKLLNKLIIKKIGDKRYTGKEVTLSDNELIVMDGKKVLVRDEDYEVSYSGDNINVGTATVVVTGKGQSYAGSKTATFKIVGNDLKKAKIDNFISSYIYNGSSQIQSKMIVTFDGNTLYGIEKDDYATLNKAQQIRYSYLIEYAKNKDVGIATMTLTGINGYSGTVKKTFKIVKYDIGKDVANLFTVNLDDTSYSYMKAGVKPIPVVSFAGKKLVEGKDYKVRYANNKAVTATSGKKATVTVTGIGNFQGNDATVAFSIVPKDISKAGIYVTASDKVATGKKNMWKSSVIVTDSEGTRLVAGRDYQTPVKYYYDNGNEVATSDIVSAGTNINIKIVGKGNYYGNASGTYRIVAKDIAKLTVKASNKSYTGMPIKLGSGDLEFYSGKSKITGVTYKIDESTYKNNLNKGKASVVINGTGEYGGSKTVTFSITFMSMTVE